ncbi:MAG: FliA/WhiG family RNA polymerase sigma factor [Peptococcaceae bacterium]|jgi:RNA polymerase sigma factor for flagellar operon FliA|nr:FliA/WhiG family RNA polymerase sigma factor [Peptococcaceae bacterium]
MENLLVHEVDNAVEMMIAYKRTNDLEMRNRLVMHYAPAIKHTIINMRAIMPQNISQEDFFHQGIISIIDCIEKFDPGRGNNFTTFLYKNLRGSMITYMRKHSWLPYRVRVARRNILQAQAELNNQLMREPTDSELAEHLQMPAKELTRNLREIAAADLVSFEELLNGTGGAVAPGYDGNVFEPGDFVGAVLDDSVDRDMMKAELQAVLAEAIDGLSPKEKQVISLCYYENLNLKEIGEVLDVSQQRISFIRSQALVKLRKTMIKYLHGEDVESC